MSGNVVLVDDRIGSKELAPHIPDSVVVRLEYGDCEFVGNGAEGEVLVGIERKKLGELVTSIRTGRLVGHQLPGMVEYYDVTYLVIEGLVRQGVDNSIEVWRKGRWGEAQTGRLGWTALYGMLTTLSTMWGVSAFFTTNLKETGELVRCLARWWGKPWKSHKAHKRIYTGERAKVSLRDGEVSVLRKVASVLPGIGYGRSDAVEKYFGSVKEMCGATVEEWSEVEGIGKVTAKRVHGALRGNCE